VDGASAGPGTDGSAAGRIEHGAGRVRWRRAACVVTTGLLLAGCASRQVVPLSIEPAAAEVYVDGARVDAAPPRSLSLRADRGHVVLIRRPGYRSRQVVLESVARDGARRLEPDRIDVRLEPVTRSGREVRIELDPSEYEREQEPAPGADAPAAEQP
jgi:hypothetical protein